MTDFKAKMHQIRLWLGIPLGELTALSRHPSWISGAASRKEEGLGCGRGGQGRGEGEGWGVEGRESPEREGPQVTVEPGLLRALLRHCGSGIFSGIFPLQE